MQVVGYETPAAEAGPALLVAAGGSLERLSLADGETLSYALGERRCAGALADGEHAPCDRPSAPFCPAHTSTWVCARCTGTCLKDEMDCHQEHAVYLAAFAPASFKVGVTKLWRLETRLREQGADRAAHVHTVANGRVARELEAGIADDVGDSVRVRAKMRGLHREVDEDAWADLLAGFEALDRFEFDYGLDLDRRPVHETMATGTVRGTKGRVLVLERGGSSYAVDLRDLVGHELLDGEVAGDHQSSLGAFG